MKTSYYASPKIKHPGLNLVCVSTSHPRWIKGLREYPPLYPGWEMVKAYKAGEIDAADSTVRYYTNVLGKLDPAAVFRDLGEDAILLCWEKAGVFCHRRIIAEWLQDNLGINVPEL